MDPEAAKLAAKLGSAAVTMAPSVKVVVEKMLGPAADAWGAHYGDRVKAFLSRNADRALAEAGRIVLESGKPASEIPLRNAISLLEGAARENDQTLSAMWSALIANASIADIESDIPPAYAHILSQLSPLEARVLAMLGDAVSGGVDRAWLVRSFAAHCSSSRAAAAVDLLESLGLCAQVKTGGEPLPRRPKSKHESEPQASLRERRPNIMKTPVHFRVELTSLGRRFLQSCRT